MLGTEDVTAMLLDTCSVQFDFTNLMIVSENVDKELLQNPSHNTHALQKLQLISTLILLLNKSQNIIQVTISCLLMVEYLHYVRF